KEPGRRPQSYEDLRTALLPFCSTAATPATLGLRLLSGIVDGAVIAIPATIFMGIYGVMPDKAAVLEQTFRSVFILAAFWIVQVSYYAIPESLWGASFGKALCGLQVVRRNHGSDLGRWRPVARAMVFCLPPLIEATIAAFIYLPPLFEASLAEAGIFRTEMMIGALFLVLFVTMRRRNGFAAIHDLVTGTRVVARPSTQKRPALEMERTPIPTVGSEQIGPYAVTRQRGELIDAWDEMLRRPVWILSRRQGEATFAMPRHQVSRVTRLRWLAGEHIGTDAWDAYEALEGMPLTALLDKRQPWSQVRFWLLDLAEEIHQAISEGSLTREIGTQHVWITRSGRAVLLDFPAPDALPGASVSIRSASDASAFLSSIADEACDPIMP
ncbi:MAG: RDD family protein, partial [Verrucomicrobiaceae bacterium]